MWYALNDAIGKILLVGIVGGGAIYAGYKVACAPPVLRQNGDTRMNQYQRQATKDHERFMRNLQEDQSRQLNKTMEVGRSVGS